METLIIDMIPTIVGHDTLLILVSCIFLLFFGSIFFSFIRSLFNGFIRDR